MVLLLQSLIARVKIGAGGGGKGRGEPFAKAPPAIAGRLCTADDIRNRGGVHAVCCSDGRTGGGEQESAAHHHGGDDADQAADRVAGVENLAHRKSP